MSTKEVFPKAEKWLPLAMTPLSLLTKKAPHSFYLPSAAIITNRKKRDRASFAKKSILVCGIMIAKRRRRTRLILFRSRQFWSMFFIEKPQDKLPQKLLSKKFLYAAATAVKTFLRPQ